nr:hypothetical protein [Burkholderiaceae bacterium]
MSDTIGPARARFRRTRGNPPDVVYLVATLSGTKLAAGLQGAGYEGMIITPSYSPLLLGSPGY